MTKLLMLAGIIVLAVVLAGRADSSNSAHADNPGSNESAQARQEVANNADDAMKGLAEGIKKIREEINKAADDLDNLRKKTSEKRKSGSTDKPGKEISAIVGSGDQDKLAYLKDLKARLDQMQGYLETVREELRKHPTNNRSPTSIDTTWDSLIYFGATLLPALLAVLAGWGAGTLAAKKRLTKAGFW
jgi:TolA-binding protein